VKIIYGPVPSWRLGRSLGIDLICSEEKRCSFDCVYCQLGRTGKHTSERGTFVDLARIEDEIQALGDSVAYDAVTFSGTGEPTLAMNLPDAHRAVQRMLKAHTALLTNSSMMADVDVREGLVDFDIVVAKLDADSEGHFKRINRPAKGIDFETMVSGLKRFREMYSGTLALDVMLIGQNMPHAEKIAKLAHEILPDEVHLNTPLRPCAVSPLEQAAMRRLSMPFKGLNVRMVYDCVDKAPRVEPMDVFQTRMRRPVVAARRGS
jgi:wyosine [tRNA(Phe)-imidazoG37] synthetase (radical SAM superfamily)